MREVAKVASTLASMNLYPGKSPVACSLNPPADEAADMVAKATELLKNAAEIYTLRKEAADPRRAKLGKRSSPHHLF